jgi:hypothetical protein
MIGKKNNTLTAFIILFIVGVFFTPSLSSCGKGGQANAVGTNVQLQVLNLSPDVHPVNLFMHYIKQSSYPYSFPTYPVSSNYFYLNNIDTPLQIRSALTGTQNLVSISNPGFQSNHKYTLFIAGQYLPDSTVSAYLLRDDTTSTPPIGFGKIRYINLAIPNTPLEIVANGTTAFHNVVFGTLTPYIIMPVGNYTFQVSTTAAPTNFLTTGLGTTTIQDGRLYTMYSYGIVGRTDTSAFNSGVLINR